MKYNLFLYGFFILRQRTTSFLFFSFFSFPFLFSQIKQKQSSVQETTTASQQTDPRIHSNAKLEHAGMDEREDEMEDKMEDGVDMERRALGNVVFQGMLNSLSMADPTLPSTNLRFPIDKEIYATVMQQGNRNIIRTAHLGGSCADAGRKPHIYMNQGTNMVRPLLKKVHYLEPFRLMLMCFFRHDTLTSGVSLSDQLLCLGHVETAMMYNLMKPSTKENGDKKFQRARRKYLKEMKASRNVKFYQFKLHESVDYMKKWMKSYCRDGYYHKKVDAMKSAVSEMTMLDTCAYYDNEDMHEPHQFTVEQGEKLRGAITNVSLQQWKHMNTDLTDRLVAAPVSTLIPTCDHRHVGDLLVEVYGNTLLVMRRSAFKMQNWNYCALYKASKMGKRWLLNESDVQLNTGTLKDIHMWGNFNQGLPNISYTIGHDLHTRVKVKKSQKFETVVHNAVSYCCAIRCLRGLFMFTRGNGIIMIHRTDVHEEVLLCNIPDVRGIDEIAFMSKTNVYVAMALCRDMHGDPTISILTLKKRKKRKNFLELVSERKIGLPAHVTGEMIDSDKDLGLKRIGVLALNNFCMVARVCVREHSTLKMMEKVLTQTDSDEGGPDWNMVSDSKVPQPMPSVYGIDENGMAVVKSYRGLRGTRSVQSVCDKEFCGGLVASHLDNVTITYPDNVVHTLENIAIRHNNVRLKFHRCSECFKHIERSHEQEKDLCHQCANDNSITIANTHHVMPVIIPLHDGCQVQILKKTWNAPVWGKISKTGLVYTLDCKWPLIQFGEWTARLSIRATESDLINGDVSKNMMQYVEFRKSSLFKRFRSVYENLDERAPTEDQLVNAFNEIDSNLKMFQGHPIFKSASFSDLTRTFIAMHDAILKNPAEAYVVDEETVEKFGFKRVREAFGFANLQRMRGIILSCHRILHPQSVPIHSEQPAPRKRKAMEAIVPTGRSLQRWGVPLSKNVRKPFLFTGTLLEKQKSVEGEFISMQDGEMCMRSGCLHAVMSYGKTVWSLNIASIVGWNTLILVPSREDIDQYSYELKERFLGCDGSPVEISRIETGPCTAPLPHLGICTYASLRSQSDENVQKLASHFHLILADEVHTIVEAESKGRKVVERLNADVIIGYSGTPYNENSKIDRFLPVRSVVRYEDMPNLCRRTIVKVQFSGTVAEEMKAAPRMIHTDVVALLKSLMAKYPTTPKLFMFYRKKASNMVAKLLGVPCVNGDTVMSLREKYVSDMRNGNLKTMVCGKCMWQGVNMPPAAILVRVENWESKQQTNQMFGRVYREHHMKDKCLIIDVSSASTEKFKELADAKDSELSVVNAKNIICMPISREEQCLIDEINQ